MCRGACFKHLDTHVHTEIEELHSKYWKYEPPPKINEPPLLSKDGDTSIQISWKAPEVAEGQPPIVTYLIRLRETGREPQDGADAETAEPAFVNKQFVNERNTDKELKTEAVVSKLKPGAYEFTVTPMNNIGYAIEESPVSGKLDLPIPNSNDGNKDTDEDVDGTECATVQGCLGWDIHGKYTRPIKRLKYRRPRDSRLTASGAVELLEEELCKGFSHYCDPWCPYRDSHMGFIYELVTGTIELELLQPAVLDVADMPNSTDERSGSECRFCGSTLDPSETICSECFLETGQSEKNSHQVLGQLEPNAPSPSSLVLAKIMLQWWHLAHPHDGLMLTPGSIEAYSLIRIMLHALQNGAQPFPAYPLNDQTKDSFNGHRWLSCASGQGHTFIRKLVKCCYDSLDAIEHDVKPPDLEIEVKDRNEVSSILIAYPVTSDCAKCTQQLKVLEGQLPQEECEAFAFKPLSSFQGTQGLLDRYCRVKKGKPSQPTDLSSVCDTLLHVCDASEQARKIVEVRLA